MNKLTQAKQDQDYVPKAIPQNCGTCRSCVPVMGEVLRYIDGDSSLGGTHYVSEQVSQKCGIGGFTVKKLGVCSLWTPKPTYTIVP